MTASTEIQRGVDIDGRGLLNSSVYRNGSELVEATPLTLKEIIYLETYAETFDHEKAMQVSGIRPDTLSRARKNNEFFNKNLLDIQQAWMEKVKLRPELMGSKLVKLTAKLEQAFDEGKHSVASPLIKAVELGMRAAGMLSSDSKDTGTQIHFTLNLGFDQPKKEKTAKIKEINIIPDNL